MILGLSHLGITVKNMEEVIAGYKESFGFHDKQREPSGFRGPARLLRTLWGRDRVGRQPQCFHSAGPGRFEASNGAAGRIRRTGTN